MQSSTTYPAAASGKSNLGFQNAIINYSHCMQSRHVQSSIGFEQRPSKSLKPASILVNDHPPWQIEHECGKMRVEPYIFDEKIIPTARFVLALLLGRL